MNTRSFLTVAGAALAALGTFATMPVHAQTAPATPAAPAAAPATTTPTRGRITTVSATSLTITPRGGDPKTFTLTPTTTIMVDGKTAAATDLPVGRYAAVTSADGTTATAVVVRARRGRAGAPPAPAAPAPPTMPATPAPGQ